MKKPLKVLSTAALAGLVGTTAFVSVAQAEQAEVTIKSFVFETAEGKVVVDMDTLIVAITSPTHPVNTLIQEEGQLKLPYGIQDNKERFITLDAFITASTNNLGKTVEEVIELIEDVVSEAEVKTFKKPVVTDGQLVLEPVVTPDPDPITELAVESVMAITTTTTKFVLAEKAETTPSIEDFKLLVNGEAVTASKLEIANDKKTVTLTHPTLDKSQGVVSVNGVEEKFDFKAPEVKSVQAVSAKQILVTFNEELSATDKDQIKVRSLTNASWAVSGTSDATAAVLQKDKSQVLVTIGHNMVGGQNNFALVLDANAVKDVVNPKGNTAYEVVFNGSAAEDTVAPALVSAQYEKATKKVTATFNRELGTSFDRSKFTISGVELTAQDSIVRGANKSQVVITLSDATKAKVDAIDGLTLDIAKDALAVDGNTQLKNVATSTTLEVVIAPELVAASSNYDENTGLLTLTFSEAIKVSSIDKTKIKVRNHTLVGGDEIQETGTTDVVTVKLADASRQAVQNTLVGDKVALVVDIDAVESAKDVKNSVKYETNITFVQNTEAPVLESARYTNADGKLRLTFNELILDESVSNSNVKLVVDGDDVDINEAFADVDVNRKVVTLTLHNNDRTAIQGFFTAGKEISVRLLEDAVYDKANNVDTSTSNGIAEIEKEDAIAVNFVDTSVPRLSGTTSGKFDASPVLTENQFKIEFTGNMQKALVENVSNYELTDLFGETVTITSVKQSPSDPRQAIVTVQGALDVTTGDDSAYRLTIKNLRSTTNILMPTTTATFDGKADAEVSAPTVSAVTFTSNQGPENDTIAVQFTSAIELDRGTVVNLANYTLTDLGTDGNGTDQLALNNDTVKSVSYNSGTKTVTFTLKTINFQVDRDYKIEVENVANILGDVVDEDNNSMYSGNGATFTTNDETFDVSTFAAIAGQGTNTMTLVFAEEVNVDTIEGEDNLENFSVVIGSDAAINPENAVLGEDLKTVELTFADDVEFDGVQDVEITLADIKDLAGNSVGSDLENVAVLVEDTVKPTFAEVDNDASPKEPIGVVVNNRSTNGSGHGDGHDQIILTFSEALQPGGAEDERNYVITVNGETIGTKANPSTFAGTDEDTPFLAELGTGADANVVTITFDSEYVDLINGDVITVTVKDGKLRDLAGLTMNEDTVSYTIAGLDAVSNNFAATSKENNKVTLQFNDHLLEDTVTASDFEFIIGGVKRTPNNFEVNDDTVTATFGLLIGNLDVKVKKSDSYSIKNDIGVAVDIPATTTVNASTTQALVNAVNAASNETEMTAALGALHDNTALSNRENKYTNVTTTEAVADRMIANRPSAGWSTPTAINNAIATAFDQLAADVSFDVSVANKNQGENIELALTSVVDAKGDNLGERNVEVTIKDSNEDVVETVTVSGFDFDGASKTITLQQNQFNTDITAAEYTFEVAISGTTESDTATIAAVVGSFGAVSDITTTSFKVVLLDRAGNAMTSIADGLTVAEKASHGLAENGDITGAALVAGMANAGTDSEGKLTVTYENISSTGENTQAVTFTIGGVDVLPAMNITVNNDNEITTVVAVSAD